MIIIEDLDTFMVALDEQFIDWHEADKTKEGKVENL